MSHRSGFKIPVYYSNILSKLRFNGFPDAAIAGGCLRDQITGQRVKDIDVFLANKAGLAMAKALLPILGPYIHTDMTKEIAEYVCNGDVHSVYTWYGSPAQLPVQIIEMNGPKTAFELACRMDFGLCQIAWDGVTVAYGPHFHSDLENKTFTLCRCENQKQFNRSMRRFERLSDKYPGFVLNIPEEFKQYAIGGTE